jgi:hypothetical protein
MTPGPARAAAASESSYGRRVPSPPWRVVRRLLLALMASLSALRVMSLGWTVFVAALIAMEKLLPGKAVAKPRNRRRAGLSRAGRGPRARARSGLAVPHGRITARRPG